MPVRLTRARAAQILLEVGGGGLETLMLVPVVGGLLLLALVCVASHARAQVAAARRGHKWRASRAASIAEGGGRAGDSLSEPLSSSAYLGSQGGEGDASGRLASRDALSNTAVAPSPLLRSAQMLESLSTAMLAEKHK